MAVTVTTESERTLATARGRGGSRAAPPAYADSQDANGSEAASDAVPDTGPAGMLGQPATSNAEPTDQPLAAAQGPDDPAPGPDIKAYPASNPALVPHHPRRRRVPRRGTAELGRHADQPREAGQRHRADLPDVDVVGLAPGSPGGLPDPLRRVGRMPGPRRSGVPPD